MSEYVSIPLNLEGVKVNHVVITDTGEIHIHVTSTVEGTHCHLCGQEIDKKYDYSREIKLRHLPILGHPTYIFFTPCRYECPDCHGNPKTTQSLPWYEQHASVTKAYEEHIVRALVNSTVQDVAEKESVGYDVVEDIIDRRVGKKVNWEEFTALATLGIDEISLKKGHRDFAVIVTVRLENGKERVLGVLENREKATVKEFFLSIPKHLRDTVRVICSDLYEGYTEAAHEVFGDQARIVVDRFHVSRLYRHTVDETRKKEMRRLKQELSEEEYEKCKGAMLLVRKDPEALTEKEKATLCLIFTYSPALLSVYLFAGALTKIFDAPHSKTEAEELLRAWMRLVEEQELHGFDKFLHTLNEKMDLITNYFVERKNSGFVEGINHKIRVMMGRCYGLFNRIRLFQRLELDLTGYEQFA